MKYIRTEDGIYRNASYPDDLVIICRDRECEVNPSDILKQADNIEELCDAFVVEDKDDYGIYYSLQLAKHIKGTLYGAIWTDKGLIYIAKMNEKGELELI